MFPTEIPRLTDISKQAADSAEHAREVARPVKIFDGYDGGMPAEINHFKGRGEELARIHAILTKEAAEEDAAITGTQRTPSSPLGRASLHGMGGVGKTTLAVTYAYTYRDFFEGVFWCRADQPVELIESLAQLAEKFGILSADEISREKAGRAALRYLAAHCDSFLLIYDNVASPDAIKTWFPSGGACVLITSRYPVWAKWAEEVPLDVLSPEDAIDFLETRTNREGEDKKGAAVLARVLDCLPLALDHAAAYCKLRGEPFTRYADRVQELIEVEFLGQPSEKTVYATFQIAIQDVMDNGCPAAGPLMDYLAWCSPYRIPLLLIDGAIGDFVEREAALTALAAVSLIKFAPLDDGTQAVTVHRLVQLVAQSGAEKAGRSKAVTDLIMLRLIVVFPTEDYDSPSVLPRCVGLLPHLLAWRQKKSSDQMISAQAATLLARAISFVVMNIRKEPQALSALAAALKFFKDLLYTEGPSLPKNFAEELKTMMASNHPFTANVLALASHLAAGNMRSFSRDLRMARFPGYRRILSGIECLIEILQEATSPSPRLPKMIKATSHLLETQWQDVNALLSYIEKQIGFD